MPGLPFVVPLLLLVLLLLLLLLLAFFLRTYRLDSQALRGDEAATVLYSALPITEATAVTAGAAM